MIWITKVFTATLKMLLMLLICPLKEWLVHNFFKRIKLPWKQIIRSQYLMLKNIVIRFLITLESQSVFQNHKVNSTELHAFNITPRIHPYITTTIKPNKAIKCFHHQTYATLLTIFSNFIHKGFKILIRRATFLGGLPS
jgi:hypothetical protein